MSALPVALSSFVDSTMRDLLESIPSEYAQGKSYLSGDKPASRQQAM